VVSASGDDGIIASEARATGDFVHFTHIRGMTTGYHVDAEWDADARVWVSSSNTPGLVVEGLLPEPRPVAHCRWLRAAGGRQGQPREMAVADQ
jgi:hypothetical protein